MAAFYKEQQGKDGDDSEMQWTMVLYTHTTRVCACALCMCVLSKDSVYTSVCVSVLDSVGIVSTQ